MDRIALFLPNWIGDVVMATPGHSRRARECFSKAHIAAVCKSYVKPLLDGSPWFDETILYDNRSRWEPRFAADIRQLRRNRFDLAVLFSNSFRTAMTAWFGGCRRRIGFARHGRSLMLSDRLQPVRDILGRLKPSPIIDDYNRLVLPLGVDEPGHRLELFTTPQDEQAANRIWEEARLDRFPEVIGLKFRRAAFGAAKHWARPTLRRACSNICRPPRQRRPRAVRSERARIGQGNRPAFRPKKCDFARRSQRVDRLDEGVRAPARSAGDDRQRPASFRRGLQPARDYAVWPDLHRMDRNLFREGHPPARESALRPMSIARLSAQSCLHARLERCTRLAGRN